MLNHEAVEPLVKKAVAAIASSFPAHHDSEDAEQALWLWVYEKQHTVIGMMTDGAIGSLVSLMKKVVVTHFMAEDATVYGYHKEDTFVYSSDLVETLLQTVFNYTDWQSFGAHGDGQPKAKAQTNMTGDVIAMLSDCKAAFETMNKAQQSVIFLAYRGGYTSEMLADEMNISAEAAKKRLSRAVQALRKRMGTKSLSDFRKGFEGRQVASTAEANYTTERDYEG